MRGKILIAHGDTQQLERAVGILSAFGFEVVATPDGGDAFARFFEEQPDLVICGENLPVLDGPSFGRMVHSQNPKLPVVLLVTDPETADASEFLVLQEPLSVNALLALVPEIKRVGKAKPAEEAGQAAVPVVEPPVNDETHEILQRFQNAGNMLAVLDASGLERMAGLAVILDRGAEERVIKEGDPCDGFYLVVDGEVRITLTERNNQEVARLSAGEFFGEMALLSNQPRSASVWTVGATRLMWFEKEAVLRLLDDYPGLRELLGGVAVQRAEENLWQALSGDDEVQKNLSDLLMGVDLPQSGSSAAPAAGDSEPLEVDLSDATGTATGAAPVAVRGRTFLGMWWLRYQALRLAAQQHRFAIGIVIGVASGMALAGGLTVWIVRNPPGELTAVSAGPGAPSGNDDRSEPWTAPMDLNGEAFGRGPLLAVQATIPEPSPPPALPQAFGPPPIEPAEEPTLVGAAAATGAAAAPTGEALPQAGDAAPETGEATPQTAEARPATEEGTKTTAGAAATPSSSPGTTPPGAAAVPERKILRRHLFKAYKDGRFAEAVKWGTEMRGAYSLDWESLLTLAHAERESGQSKLALQDYLDFVAAYPNYVVTDDAQFWAAEILMTEGNVGEARALYHAVAKNPKSDFRTSAEARLQALAAAKAR